MGEFTTPQLSYLINALIQFADQIKGELENSNSSSRNHQDRVRQLVGLLNDLVKDKYTIGVNAEEMEQIRVWLKKIISENQLKSDVLSDGHPLAQKATSHVVAEALNNATNSDLQSDVSRAVNWMSWSGRSSCSSSTQPIDGQRDLIDKILFHLHAMKRCVGSGDEPFDLGSIYEVIGIKKEDVAREKLLADKKAQCISYVKRSTQACREILTILKGKTKKGDIDRIIIELEEKISQQIDAINAATHDGYLDLYVPGRGNNERKSKFQMLFIRQLAAPLTIEAIKTLLTLIVPVPVDGILDSVVGLTEAEIKKIYAYMISSAAGSAAEPLMGCMSKCPQQSYNRIFTSDVDDHLGRVIMTLQTMLETGADNTD